MGSTLCKGSAAGSKESAKDVIAEQLAKNNVMVFSKSFCPYCSKAKQALKSVMGSTSFGVMELDFTRGGSAIQDELAHMTGARSVPRVFVNGKFIGGGDETAALAASGKLKAMLIANGILPPK